MKKTNTIIIFFILVLVGGVMAETTMNFLTKGFADTLYCPKFGTCTLTSMILDNLIVGNLTMINGTMTILNVTLVNYNVTGEVNVDGNIIVDSIFAKFYNWIIKAGRSRDYADFNGTDWSWNETTLNNTIINAASIYNDTDLILWENSTGVIKAKSSQDLNMQDGDISIRDSDNEFHNLSRTLQIIDEMNRNITLSGLNGTLGLDGNLIITTKTGGNIIVNIDKKETILNKNTDSIIITSGTNESPILNQMVYTNIDNPVLTKRTTLGLKSPGVATFLQGENFTYVSAIGLATIDNLVGGLFNTFFRDGATYRSGFEINVTTNMINISTGVIGFLFKEIDIILNHSTSDLYVHVHSDDSFHQHTDLNQCADYNDGSSIGNNKFFNMVLGIAITHDGAGVMYATTQDLPSTEYTRAIDAEVGLVVPIPTLSPVSVNITSVPEFVQGISVKSL